MIHTFRRLEMVPPTPGMLAQQIEQIDEKHETGHVRLRQDLRQLELDVAELKRAHEEMALAQTKQAAKPIEFDDVKFTPKIVITLGVALFTIVGSEVGTAWALRSDFRELASSVSGTTRMQSSQIEELRKSYDALIREQALERIRLEETRNSLSKIEGLMTNLKGSAK